MPGMAVIGCAGGVGTTVLAAALALASGDTPVRVLGLDAHGGGPHDLWGMRPDRGVDDLVAVRGEVDEAHVAHVVHRHRGRLEVVMGPGDAMSTAAWQPHADRLAAALVPAGGWVADLGRGDHCLGRSVTARAACVVLVTAASPASVAACRQHLDTLAHARPVLVAMLRRHDESLSARAARRLLGHDIVELPWDRSGVERCAAAEPGRRGMWKAVHSLVDGAVGNA